MSHPYEAQIAALEAKYRELPRGEVAFYGSSSIRLWPRLNRDFPAVSPANFGFGGSTLADCAGFFERLFAPHPPRALVIYAGDNDLALGASPGEVCASLRLLLQACDASCGAVPLAFLALKPSPSRLELMPEIKEANRLLKREIMAREGALWVDTFHPMLGENGAPREELFMRDGLHLSRGGYDLWREIATRDAPFLSAENGAASRFAAVASDS